MGWEDEIDLKNFDKQIEKTDSNFLIQKILINTLIRLFK